MLLHCLTPLLNAYIIETTILPDHCKFFHIGPYSVVNSYFHIINITEKEKAHTSWMAGKVEMHSCNFAYPTSLDHILQVKP